MHRFTHLSHRGKWSAFVFMLLAAFACDVPAHSSVDGAKNPPQKFISLHAARNMAVKNRHVPAPAARFIPLKKNLIQLPIYKKPEPVTPGKIHAPVEKTGELFPSPPPSPSSAKGNMTSSQAKQILSIFAPGS